MTEMTYSPEDVRALATKLDSVTASFDEREQAFLVAIIGLAREALDTKANEEARGFASGQPALSEIVVTKRTDMASPKLFDAVTSLAPVEHVTLNYGEIEWTYTKQK